MFKTTRRCRVDATFTRPPFYSDYSVLILPQPTHSHHRNTQNSFVGVWLGTQRIAQTNGAAPSPVVVFQFPYSDGQVLSIRDEGANAVAEIDSIYFLSSCTDAPTAAPTAAPSGWYQNSNVPDLNDMYTRLQTTEAQVVALTSTTSTSVATLSSGVDTLNGYVGAIQVAAQSNADVQSTLVSTQLVMSSSVDSIGTSVSNVVSALRTAVSTAAVGGGGSSTPPMVSTSSSNDLVFSSGAGVTVTSGQCTNSDLCGAASFAATLKTALNGV